MEDTIDREGEEEEEEEKKEEDEEDMDDVWIVNKCKR